MPFYVECLPVGDGVDSVAPCASVDGVGYAPYMADRSGEPLTYEGLGQLFAFSLSIVLICFVVGSAIGAIMRVIRAT